MQRRLRLVGFFLVLLAIVGLAPKAGAATASRQNQYPIVLVHGLTGWGRDELLGFKYWGGLVDLQEEMNRTGHTTYTAAVGPFSSNWDRAVELYAQIKGGRVDYGAAHAAQHGHARYGRTFPGLYPDWGTVDPATGKVRKVHLIGHSQGGQTIRVLAQLLGEGNAAEVAATPANELSPLFATTRKSWVHSVTTLTSPHDGSSLVYAVNAFLPFAQQLVATVAALAGSSAMNVYDFKLDQWGLKRNPGESFDSYANRVWNSSLWTTTKDISAWDLSPDGAKELNSWVKAQPDVYYFSWSAEETYRSIFTGHQIPEIGMNVALLSGTYWMGSYTRNETGKVKIDSSWWQNDGAANTNSMDGPSLGSTDTIVAYNGTPKIGTWNHMGILDSTDHLDIIGLDIFHDVRGWYRDRATFLGSLPQ